MFGGDFCVLFHGDLPGEGQAADGCWVGYGGDCGGVGLQGLLVEFGRGGGGGGVGEGGGRGGGWDGERGRDGRVWDAV